MAFKLFMEKGWGGARLPLPLDRRFPVGSAKACSTKSGTGRSALSTLSALVGALRQLADQGVSSRGSIAAVSHLHQQAHIRLNLNWAGEVA
jgi:hypothetical protein